MNQGDHDLRESGNGESGNGPQGLSPQGGGAAGEGICRCTSCGYQWQRRADGSHSCVSELRELLRGMIPDARCLIPLRVAYVLGANPNPTGALQTTGAAVLEVFGIQLDDLERLPAGRARSLRTLELGIGLQMMELRGVFRGCEAQMAAVKGRVQGLCAENDAQERAAEEKGARP